MLPCHGPYTTDMSTDTANITGVTFIVPPGANPLTYDPPYTPYLNTSDFTTCFYVVMRYSATATTPPLFSNQSSGSSGGDESSNSDLLDILGQLFDSTTAPDGSAPAPYPSGDSGQYPSSASSNTANGSGSNNSGDGDNDMPPVNIIQSGALSSEPYSPFRTYRSCMNTWTALKAELMMLNLFLPGVLTMDFICCNTNACNYNLDGAAPPQLQAPPPAPPAPSPPRPRRHRPPSPPRQPPMAPQPSGYTDSSGSGMIALRVILVLVVVVCTLASVWFCCKQHRQQGHEGKAVQLAGVGKVAVAQATERTVLLGADRV